MGLLIFPQLASFRSTISPREVLSSESWHPCMPVNWAHNAGVTERSSAVLMAQAASRTKALREGQARRVFMNPFNQSQLCHLSTSSYGPKYRVRDPLVRLSVVNTTTWKSFITNACISQDVITDTNNIQETTFSRILGHCVPFSVHSKI